MRSIFGILTPEEVQVLEKSFRCLHFKKGHTIFQEGAFPNGIYVLNHGKVKITKMGLDGKEQIVRLTRDPDILGYRALLSKETYAASATTIEDTQACFIDGETLRELFKMNTELAGRIMELLAKDLRSAEEKMTILAQNSVRERLAQSLLVLRETFGLKDDGKTLDVQLSREELANIIGTATETVIRLLAEFKKDGLIDLEKKQILILDPDNLLRVANISI